MQSNKMEPFIKLIGGLILSTLLHQFCLASTSDKDLLAAADIQKNSFIRSAPLPAWALPLSPIPETSRTDPIVLRLSEYQIQLGAEPVMLLNQAMQVNERAVLSKIGQFSIVYYPIFQKLKLHRVALLRAGHVIDKMDGVNIRQLQRETGMESGIYGGATTVELLLDDVRIGDTLWVTYSVSGANPVFDKKWHSEIAWDYGYPIELRRVTVNYPSGRSINWDQIGDFNKDLIPSRVEEINGQRRIQFEDRGIEAIDFEPAVPADYLPIRFLEFSEFADWQGVAKWANSLFPRNKPGPLLNDLVKTFVREQTQEQKAAAALHWVQNEVRYFSVSIGENSHRPQAPEVVIKKRYGDCKDKSYLLVSILTQMGIKASPVLIASHAPKIPLKVLASPEWFDHAIVRIEINEHQYFVDPTITGQVSPLESLPTAMPGAAGLLVDSATTDLITLPERSEVTPNYEHVEHLVIARLDGDVALDMQDTYSGFYSDFARNHFINLSETELRREVLSFYEKQYPGVTISGKPELSDDKEKNQFHIHALFNLPAPVQHQNQIYKVNFDSQILKGTLKIPDKLVRNFPFQINSGKHFARYRVTIDWPDNVHIDFPASEKNIDNAYFSVHDETRMRDSQISYVMEFRIKNDIVPTAEMVVLNDQTKLLDQYGSTSFRIPDSLVSGTDSWTPQLRSLNGSKAGTPTGDRADSDMQSEKLAARKLHESQTEQGHVYYFGKGVPVDYPKAIEWYSKAALGGNSVAQFNLAVMYERGQGVVKDYDRAIELYRMAAEQGYTAAQNALGNFYRLGTGVDKNLTQARNWYQRAADHGFTKAQSNLGELFRTTGKDLADYNEALDWLRRAAMQGDVDALNSLGIMYQLGQGIPKDYVVAYAFYNKAYTDNKSDNTIISANRDKVAKLMFNADIDAAQKLSLEMGKSGNLLEAIDAYIKNRSPVNADTGCINHCEKLTETITQSAAQHIPVEIEPPTTAVNDRKNIQVIKEVELFRLWEKSSLSGLDQSVFRKSEQQSLLAQIAFKMLGTYPAQCHDQFEFVAARSSRQFNPGAESKHRSELWKLLGCGQVKKFVVFEMEGKVHFTPYEFDD